MIFNKKYQPFRKYILFRYGWYCCLHSNNGFKATVDGKEYTITTDGTTAIAANKTYDGEYLAKAIAKAVNEDTTNTTIKGTKADGTEGGTALKGVVIDGMVYKAEAKGSTVVFTLQDKSGTDTVTQTPAGTIKDGTKLTIGDTAYVFAIGKDSKVEAGDGETLIDMKDVAADDTQLVDKAIAKLTQ